MVFLNLRWPQYLWYIIICVGCLTILNAPLSAQQIIEDKGSEYRIVKAIYYLLVRSEFPGTRGNSNLLLCIEKANDLTIDISEYFPSKRVGNMAVQVKVWPQFKNYDLKECDVIVLGSRDDENKLILMSLGEAPVLTISTISDITSVGGIIYMPQSKRMPPKINLTALTRAGILIDASILSLSQRAWGAAQ